MTKPSQYPEKCTRPMRHIHHSTIVWLDPVWQDKDSEDSALSNMRIASLADQNSVAI